MFLFETGPVNISPSKSVGNRRCQSPLCFSLPRSWSHLKVDISSAVNHSSEGVFNVFSIHFLSLHGHTFARTFPVISASGSGPYVLESLDADRLSPKSQTWPSGTYTTTSRSTLFLALYSLSGNPFPQDSLESSVSAPPCLPQGNLA